MKQDWFRVIVLEQSNGVMQGCKMCGTILKTGTFLIGLHICENEKNFRYILAAPPQKHCGEAKTIFECFDTKEEAEAKKAEIIAHLLEKGTTKELPLIGFFDPTSN